MIDQKVLDEAARDWGFGGDTPPVPTGESFERTTVRQDAPGLVRGAWRNADEMIAAINRAYPEGSFARTVRVNAYGQVERQIQRHSGNAPVGDEHGRLLHEVIREWVPVAFDQQSAREASTKGVRTDWFNGWSWVKGGIKQERDRHSAALLPGANPNVEIVYEPAPESDQMRYRAQVAALSAASGVVPLPQPARRGRKSAGEE